MQGKLPVIFKLIRMIEHIRKDKNSHVYKHIHNSEECFTKYTTDCFSILDTATYLYDICILIHLFIYLSYLFVFYIYLLCFYIFTL